MSLIHFFFAQRGRGQGFGEGMQNFALESRQRMSDEGRSAVQLQ